MITVCKLSESGSSYPHLCDGCDGHMGALGEDPIVGVIGYEVLVCVSCIWELHDGLALAQEPGPAAGGEP